MADVDCVVEQPEEAYPQLIPTYENDFVQGIYPTPFGMSQILPLGNGFGDMFGHHDKDDGSGSNRGYLFTPDSLRRPPAPLAHHLLPATRGREIPLLECETLPPTGTQSRPKSRPSEG